MRNWPGSELSGPWISRECDKIPSARSILRMQSPGRFACRHLLVRGMVSCVQKTTAVFLRGRPSRLNRPTSLHARPLTSRFFTEGPYHMVCTLARHDPSPRVLHAAPPSQPARTQLGHNTLWEHSGSEYHPGSSTLAASILSLISTQYY